MTSTNPAHGGANASGPALRAAAKTPQNTPPAPLPGPDPNPNPYRDPLTIRCRYCGANPGETCLNLITKQPLEKWPTHPARDHDAHQPAPPVSKPEPTNSDEVPW